MNTKESAVDHDTITSAPTMNKAPSTNSIHDTLTWMETYKQRKESQESILQRLESSEFQKAKTAKRKKAESSNNDRMIASSLQEEHESYRTGIANWFARNKIVRSSNINSSLSRNQSTAASNFLPTVTTNEMEQEDLQSSLPINILCLDGGGSKGEIEIKFMITIIQNIKNKNPTFIDDN